MKPDFSAATLKAFLQIWVAYRMITHEVSENAAKRAVCREISGLAGVTRRAVERAMIGRLNQVATRGAIWAVLGHFPSDYGVVLTDDGKQISA